MTTTDILEETYVALSANKARSILTMLGIIIGIASVIAMISIGQGAQQSISANIASIGSNLVMIMPGAARSFGGPSAGRGSAQTLTVEDGEAIQNGVANIAAIAFDVSARAQATAKGTNTNTSIIGTTPSYTTVRNVEIDDGSFFADAQVQSAAKVAVVGPTVQTDLFGDGGTALGQTIRIKGIEFKIIGVTKTKGGSGFSNTDDTIYIPYTSAQRYLTGNKYLTEIDISGIDSNSSSLVQSDVTDLLLTRHHISDPASADFNLLNQADIVATASSVTNTFTILLSSVAAISLVVGGIGIMNMMLTTVTERTREIGLRKAIGAKAHDINMQFLAEAVALTFIGGLIGVAIGWLIAFGVTYFGILQTKVSLSSILLAFGVSAGIGIIFGYYPARRAAKMNPIEALRFE
ncbi:MAG: ABC transporter permease [Patescibacteria group bacterium]